MKLLALAMLTILPSAAAADPMAELLASKCPILTAINGNTAVLREDLAIAYDALLASWTVVTDALEIAPPLVETCNGNPQLTVEEALRAALAKVK